MDVEIAGITQLTNSVQLAEPQNLRSPQLENNSDTGMDLDADTNTSKHFPSNHGSGLGVLLNDTPKLGQVEDFGAHTQIGGSWGLSSEYEGLGNGEDAILTSHIKLLSSAWVNDPHDVLHPIFENIGSQEDDPDDSEWLDSVSVRADTQSIIAGDSEDEYDGETGEDDDEMLSGDEAVLAGVWD